MNRHESNDFLRTQKWEDGKIIVLGEGSYRHRIVAFCSSGAIRQGEFANGPGKYCEFIQFMDRDGNWIRGGNGIAPLLPDGRVLMVLDRRPAQSQHGPRPTMAKIGGRTMDLSQFGPDVSLELSGGALKLHEDVRVGALREMMEENGVERQRVKLYHCLRPVHTFGSDVSIQGHSNVVLLSGLTYKEKVRTDGGLQVFALTMGEIQENIWNGVICSGQAALVTLNFLWEVLPIINGQMSAEPMVKAGYLSIQDIELTKS